jgi:hypothetical protein
MAQRPTHPVVACPRSPPSLSWQSSQHQFGRGRSPIPLHCPFTHTQAIALALWGRPGWAGLDPKLDGGAPKNLSASAPPRHLLGSRASLPMFPASATTILTLISLHTRPTKQAAPVHPLHKNEDLFHPLGPCRPVHRLQCFYAQGAYAQGRCRPRRRPW